MPRRARKYTVPFWDDWMNKKLNESMELEQNLVAKGYPQLQVILMKLALHNYCSVLHINFNKINTFKD